MQKDITPGHSPYLESIAPAEISIDGDPANDIPRLYNNLKLNEARLDLAAKAAGAGLWSLDLATNLFWANDRTREMFCFPKSGDVPFQDFIARVHPEDIRIIEDAIENTLLKGDAINIEYRLFLPDGSFCWVQSRGAVHHSEIKLESSCITGISVDITSRRSQEQLIARQLQFESLLLELSASVTGVLLPEDLDRLIELALGKILNFIGGDRSALIKLDLEQSKSLITHAHYREGLVPVSPDIDLVSLFPWSFNLLKEGHWHCFSSLDELPPEAAIDRHTYETMGVKSSLRVPIRVENNVYYLLIINSLADWISWPEETLPRLQIFCEILTRAIYRKKAEEELNNSYKEISNLKEKLEAEAGHLRAEVRASQSHEKIIGQSVPLGKVLVMVEQVAPTASTVLVYGETGTGKELIAQAIHNCSPRRNKLMVKINCASLPSSLVESELFGRERGAYTGALTRQIGRFELSDGSTLFLDEIAELSLELQAKLLRVLQEGEFERLGSPRTIKVNVRLIAATNRNLREEVDKGKFREDLYYRLNVFPIHVPPLRERREDIPMLVWAFVREFNETMGKKISRIRKNDMTELQAHYWPGNIRELRNVIEHAVIVSQGEELKVRLPENGLNNSVHNLSLQDLERRHIEEILRQTGWRIKGDGGAAGILGLNPATLYSRMKKLGISHQREKDGI